MHGHLPERALLFFKRNLRRDLYFLGTDLTQLTLVNILYKINIFLSSCQL